MIILKLNHKIYFSSVEKALKQLLDSDTVGLMTELVGFVVSDITPRLYKTLAHKTVKYFAWQCRLERRQFLIGVEERTLQSIEEETC